MKKEWKFEPDPLTRGYIEFLDKSPIEFDKATELMNNKLMEYDEMMFLAKMKRKAKVEFENNLWKQRFEELNGFPMEEGLGKENIIMPFSENDYLENKTIDKVTE